MTGHLWKTADGDDIFSHTFTIKGMSVSQKNNRPIHRKANGVPFIGTSVKVSQWKTSAIRQLRSCWKYPPIPDKNIRACFVIYQGKGQHLDADNAMAGAFDALQAAGIIKNDYQLSCGAWSRERDRENPRIEITLTRVDEPPEKEKQPNGKQPTKSSSEEVFAQVTIPARRIR